MYEVGKSLSLKEIDLLPRKNKLSVLSNYIGGKLEERNWESALSGYEVYIRDFGKEGLNDGLADGYVVASLMRADELLDRGTICDRRRHSFKEIETAEELLHGTGVGIEKEPWRSKFIGAMDSLLSEPPFYASWAEKIKEWLSQAKISIKWEPYESYFTQIAIDRIGMPDFKKIVKLGKIDTNGEAYRLAVIREAERQETIFNDPWRALKLFEHIGIDISQYPEYRNGLVQAAYSKLCGKRWLSTDISTEDGLELDGLYRFLKKMGEEPNVNRALEMPDRNLEQGNLHAAMQGYDAIDSTTNIGPERKRILKLLEHNSGKYKWEQLDIPTRIKIQIMAKRAGIKSPSFI